MPHASRRCSWDSIRVWLPNAHLACTTDAPVTISTTGQIFNFSSFPTDSSFLLKAKSTDALAVSTTGTARFNWANTGLSSDNTATTPTVASGDAFRTFALSGDSGQAWIIPGSIFKRQGGNRTTRRQTVRQAKAPVRLCPRQQQRQHLTRRHLDGCWRS